MENKKYKVCRDNIYVGEVVKTRYVFCRGLKNSKFDEKKEQLTLQSWKSYRSMLFVPDKDGFANDLLYNSPNYPILNMSDNEACMYFDRSIILINDACNIAKLLEYFGYEKELSYEDIIEIRKTFFTGKFAQQHCKLFGMKETKPEDWTYYRHGVEITDPRKLKKCIAHEKRAQLMGYRSFVSIEENVLPREYWDVLIDRGNNSLIDVLNGWCNKINVFIPHKNEEKVKKLTRF